MPTYMLEGTSEVGLSLRPLTVSLRLDPPHLQGRLEAMSRGHLVDVVRPRADLLVIPSVQDLVTIRVVPVGAERFPAAATAHVSISVDDAGGGDPERAVLLPLDLAGLDAADALVLERGELTVRVRAAQVAPPPSDLGPVGNAARVAATALLGVQRVAEAVDVAVVIDGSASLRPLVADGSVGTLLAVLEGICQVVSPGRPILALIRGLADHVVDVPAGDLAGATVRALHARAPSTGFRAHGPHVPAADRAVTFLVSDAAPSDLPELTRAGASGGSATHLIVLGSRAVGELMGVQAGGGTLVDTGLAGSDLAQQLTSDVSALRELVAQLLTALPAQAQPLREGHLL